MDNPIDNGIQQVYIDIRESLELILRADETTDILSSLDDAVSNNWDELMDSFYRGIAEGCHIL